MSIQVTNFGNTLGLPAGYVEAITAIVDEEIKFCVQNPTTNGTTGQVPVFSNPQLIRPTNVVIDNTDSLSVGGTITVGNNVPATNYTLPSAIGVPQQVLQVPAVGNELEWANNATTVPTFLNTLTVDELSQGPNALTKNYILPNYAPPPNSLLASATTYIMTFTVNASISFRVDNAVGGTIPFREEIPIGIYLVSDILSRLETTTRSVLSANNIIADIIFGYNSITDRFEIVLTNQVTPSNFLNFWWEAYDPLSPIPNNNNLFGIGVIIEPRLILPPIQTVVCQNAPIGVSLGTDCVWRSFASVQIPGIQSESGAVAIQCEDVGIGQSGIISYGNYNLNNGSLNNCGNINALDNCNITTNTTQIENGLGELNISINSLPRITQNAIKTKLECGTSRLQLAAVSDLLTDDTSTYFASQNALLTKNMAIAIASDTLVINQDYGAVNRLVVDDSITGLYSKNATSGPAGSLLELNNDNTFTLGCYFANNGIIECRPDSMAMYGNSANSSFIMTGSNITTALSNGSGRIDREILDTTSQSFRDPTGIERLKIDNSGVTICNDYTLPIFDGTANQVLTTDGAGTITWQSPTTFNQALNTTNDVSFNSVTTPTIDTSGTLTIGGVSATSVNIGRTGITTTLKGTTSIDSLFTLPTTTGITGQYLTRNSGSSSIWSTPQLYGLYSQTGTQTVAGTVAETTLIGPGVGSLSVPANYFTTGMAFRYNTGGTFRDNANNTTFRFRLRNGGILFDSGNLTLPLITTVSAWNIDVTFSYVGGTTIITNFNFQYNAGSDARGFTSQNTNNTLNTTIPNTLNFTVQWGASSANNTITTNFGVLQKIY